MMRAGRRARRALAIASVAVGVLATAPSALANTVLHVDAVNGTDAGNCLSSPCKTLSYAILQGIMIPDLITIDAAPGNYTEDLALGSADTGLTIVGAGDGTSPATSTIITGVAGNPAIVTDASGSAGSLTLSSLRIVTPPGMTQDALDAISTDLGLTNVAIDVQGTGNGVVDVGGDVTWDGGSDTLENTGGSGSGLQATGSGQSLSVTNVPVSVASLGGYGVIDTAGSLTMTGSSVALTNTASASADGIVDTAGPTTISNSPVDVKGTGTQSGIVSTTGPLTVSGSPVTLDNPANASGSGIVGVSGTTNVSTNVSSSPVTMAGLSPAIVSTVPTTISDEVLTMSNASNSGSALVAADGSLSHLTISGSWIGSALAGTGSLAISDSTMTSSPGATSPLLTLASSTTLGHNVSIERSVLEEPSTTQSLITAQNDNMAIVSSELLGGSSTSFAVSGGVSRLLTLVSSTVDAGALGVRDSSPSIASVNASTDSTAGSSAEVQVEGSILVEAPVATHGTGASSTIECSNTEVPSTSQSAGPTTGAILCETGADGNNFTPALSSIFANPATGYALNPSWSGVDSVPASAISVPAPFSDSATDVLGNPRVLNGIGTCQPGLRDRGAIELTGHAGVVPAPVISGPASVPRGKTVSFTATASNDSVPVTFAWSSGDGATATGSSLNHAFAHTGTYTVSVTVTGATACVATKSQTVSVFGPEKLSTVKLSHKSFRAAGSGGSVSSSKGKGRTVISYTGTEPATTTLTVQVKRRRKWVKVGSFTHSDAVGKVSFGFTGRIKGHKLPAGVYRLKVVANDGAGPSNTRLVGFTITG
jgi:PKD repeat protein